VSIHEEVQKREKVSTKRKQPGIKKKGQLNEGEELGKRSRR
jgi:hypothetical protein